LSYVASENTGASALQRVPPDPKDCISLYSRRGNVSSMSAVGALHCD
jgi:hypothetical protein